MDLLQDIVHFNNQVYTTLHNSHAGRSNPFVDQTFPPEPKSISRTGKFGTYINAEWKRPKDICSNPKLFIDGASVHDVCQGHLGNCWLISSMATLANHPKYLYKVIPNVKGQQAQLMDPDSYSGVFKFMFWRYGQWIQVVVDDLLPTNSMGQLLFAHSKDKSEFWSALLEKAYAKLAGSYEDLIGGQEEEALCDFTGGMPEQIFDMYKYAQTDLEMTALYNILSSDWLAGAVICSSIASLTGKMEERLPNGLCTTHAYSVTGLLQLPIKGVLFDAKYAGMDCIMLIRMRNPWGEFEWRGSFCDKSSEWNAFSEEDKKQLNFQIKNDGEFWMPFKDWLLNFNQITLVRMVKDRSTAYNRQWFCSFFKNTFNQDSVITNRTTALNSHHDCRVQYYFNIDNTEGNTILLHLLQICDRLKETGIGLLLFKVERNRLTSLYHLKWCQVLLEFRIGGSRSICMRQNLEYGSYIILPFVTKPPKNKTLNYVLRIFKTDKNVACMLTNSSPTVEPGCFCNAFTTNVVTRLQVIRADLNSNFESSPNCEYYCEIQCENKKSVTRHCRPLSTKIEWNESFLFYRTASNKYPLLIKVIEKGTLINRVIGCSIVPENILDSKESKCLPVFESNLRNLSSKVKGICLEWYNTRSIKNL